uniref:tRNA-binding domain-containing protein n=1 Tax=Salix viminalis TaxID=40686 RepID=A0A6N2KGY5_SALVM
MATATMAATAAKLIKGGGSPQLLLSSSKLALSFPCFPLIIHKKKKPVNNIRLLISFSAARHNYHLHHSFCTTANVNADAISTSGSESQSGGDAPSDDAGAILSKIKDAGNLLDIRVGRVIKAWRHEEADSLYVEQVDVGEAEPRIFVAQRNVVVLANLKPRNMRGVKSNGMLMAASDASHEHVELLHPPDGSIPGERICLDPLMTKLTFRSCLSQSGKWIQKKKIWESVQPHLKTDDSCMAILGGEHFMRTSAGVVASKSLNNANIS